MKTSTKDLRVHTKRILDAVDRGEEVTITHRGVPRAKLVALRKPRAAKKSGATALFGMWRRHEASRDVAGYVRKLRRGRH